MIRIEIIEKIKKLRLMAEGNANVNEAALAAARIQEIIERHRIEEVELCELLEDEEISNEMLAEEDGPSLRNWKIFLASTLATFNNCKLLVFKGRRASRCYPSRNARLDLVGTHANVATVRYLFLALVRDIEQLCDQALQCRKGEGKSWANSFRLGAAQTVKKRLTEARNRAREGVSTTTLERVDNESSRVETWATENIKIAPKPLNISHSCRSADGFFAGQKAGQKLDLYDARKAALGQSKLALRGRG